MQNPKQAAVVDPILTTVARGHRNQKFIAQVLFPKVPVPSRTGTIISFGDEHFELYSTARAHGTDIGTIDISYDGAPFALKQYALGAKVTLEQEQEAKAALKLDISTIAVNRVIEIMLLDQEYRAAQLALNPANYGAANKATLSGSSQWSHPDSDPNAAIETAIAAISNATGEDANVAVLSRPVFAKVRRHPKVVEQFRYTSLASKPVTAKMLAELWELEEVAIGKAAYKDANGVRQQVWAKDAVVAYTPPASLQDRGSPSYGYSYELDGYPMVEEGFFSSQKRAWIHNVIHEILPVIAGPGAGYLFTNAVA